MQVEGEDKVTLYLCFLISAVCLPYRLTIEVILIDS